MLLQINTTGAAVNASVSLGGQQLAVVYGAGQANLFALSVSNLSLNIDNIVSVEGNVSLSSFTDPTNGIKGEDFAGTDLTVFVGNGPVLLAGGNANPLAVGVEITNATLALFTDGSGNYALSANGTVALVGTGSVSASGTAAVLVNTFQDQFADTIALPGSSSQTVPLAFGPTQQATSTAPFFSVSGTGGLNILGQTLSGAFTVSDPSGTIVIALSNVQLSISAGAGSASSRGPPLIAITGGTGEIDITGAGVTGGVSGAITISPPGATLTGTFQLLVNTTAQASSVTLAGSSTSLPAGPYFELSAPGSGSTPGATLTAGSQSLSGDFTLAVASNGGVTTASATISNATLTIAAGGTTYLALGNGQGTLSVSPLGVLGTLSAQVTSDSLPGLTVSAVEIAVNTTSSASGGVPAGPFFGIEADGASIAIGGQTLTGDFGVEVSSAAGSPVVIAAVSNAAVSLGGGLATLAGGGGALLVSGTGVAASLAGTITVNVPGISISGSLSVQLNTTGKAITSTFAMGAQNVTLNLPGGSASYLQVAGSGVAIAVLGQTLDGSFTLTSQTGAGGTTTTLSVISASLSLGGGVVSATGVSGNLTLDSGGASGSLSGALSITAPDASLSASNVAVNFDTHAATSAFNITVSTPSIVIAGVSVGADSFTISVGQATGAGAGTVVEVSVSNLTLSLGTFVNITSANGLSGTLVVGGGGVAAELSLAGIGSIFTIPGVTIGNEPSGPAASFAFEVNTGSSAVDETVGSQTIDVPAGPYLQVLLQNASLTIGTGGSAPSLGGSFAFEQQGSGSAAQTLVAASGVSASVGGAALTGGQGVLVLTSTGMAGYVSGTGSGSYSGVSVSGTVLLQINTTGGAVSASVLVGGQTVTVNYGASQGNLFSLSVSNLSLNIDNVVTLEGTISYSTFTASGVPGKAFAGSGLTLFFGNGPALLSSGDPNPLAVGVQISNATVALFTDGTHYALSASGTVRLLGTGSVSASGQATILVNTFSQQFNDTIALPGSGGQSVPLVFGPSQVATTAPFFSVGALGLNVSVLGQTLSGDVSVTDPNGVIEVSFSNAQVSLSDGNGSVGARGPPLAQLTGGTGELDFSSAGVAAQLSGSVTFAVPGVSLAGTFALDVNTQAQAVTLGGSGAQLPAGPYFQLSGANVSLSVAGQSLSGNFTVSQALVSGVSTTVVTVAGGALSIAAGGVTYLAVSGAVGTFTVGSAGVVGSLSATVQTLAIPDVTLGTVAIALNTTSVASGDIPAGPFFGIEAVGASLTIGGQSLSGNFGVELSTSSGGGAVVAVSVSNAAASFGSGLATLTGGSGALLVSASGIAGSFTGTIAVNVPGVSVSGTLSVQVNSTGAVVSETVGLGAGSVVLNLPAGQSASPYLQVAGTGVVLSVLGQSFSGNVTVSSASGITTVALSGASLSLGGGVVSLSDVAGSVTVDPGGAKGSISGALSVGVPGVSVSAASVAVSFDTHAGSAQFAITAADASVSIAGQTLVGNLVISQGTDASGAGAVLIALENLPSDSPALGAPLLTLGPAGAPVLTVANGQGELLITSQGVAGDLELSGVNVSLPAGISLGVGTFSLQASTIATAVNEQFTIGGQTQSLTLPAGPYVSVSVTGVSLSIGSNSLSGNFLFQEQGSGSSAVTVIAASDVSASAGSGSSGVALSSGQGALVITAAGIAGIVSGRCRCRQAEAPGCREALRRPWRSIAAGRRRRVPRWIRA